MGGQTLTLSYIPDVTSFGMLRRNLEIQHIREREREGRPVDPFMKVEYMRLIFAGRQLQDRDIMGRWLAKEGAMHLVTRLAPEPNTIPTERMFEPIVEPIEPAEPPLELTEEEAGHAGEEKDLASHLRGFNIE